MIIKEMFCCADPDESNGALAVAESLSEAVPFEIKRVYYIYGVEAKKIRGLHAHKELEQILICVHGKIEVTLDDGCGKVDTIILKSPAKGLYVGPSMWRTMKWIESNSVLLVLASQHYAEKDYIRNYSDFCKWANGKDMTK